MSTKTEILILLEESKYPELIEVCRRKRNVPALLISLTYDKERLLCWRAIEAMGLLAAEISRADPAEARNLAQRILWMMREESGNNAWSAPEMLGEIVRNCPDELSDFAPIIASFHDEGLFRSGVMRAIFRIAETRPDLVRSAAVPLVGLYLRDADATVRIYSVLLAGRLGLREYTSAVEDLCSDRSEITLYRDGGLMTVILGKTAEEIVTLLRSEANRW